ncbi:MAG: phosphate/phosphite/phosphonate ABC transporter substrate-binding protein [Desulfobacteraceae bacterium]|nr:phosphate/phosphite/phosphonate ABC transporter substrate-binding protein [Desulfobacteraceae bacterium]
MLRKPTYEEKQPSKHFVRLIIYIIATILAAYSLAGCDSGTERKNIDLKKGISAEKLSKMKPKLESNVFFFGFDLRATPEEDARQYVPFLKYLDKTTGYKFRLRFTPKDQSIIQNIGTGKIHFAAMGAGSYLKAHAKYNVSIIVRGLNLSGKAEYQSLIIVSPNSKISEIKDLHGKKFAFGHITSTQGHIIPRIVLAEHGLNLEDLASYKYTGSHYECAKAVTSGNFDAGGIQDIMGRNLAQKGLVKILNTSKYYPSSSIVANRNVLNEVITKVKKALIDFQPQGRDSEGLYHWSKTEMPNGFIEARDKDYQELRKWNVKFGYL